MSRFLVCAVPAALWDSSRPRATPPTDDELLREQVLEAAAIRRRVGSGVNLESERSRLTATLGRIESEVLRRLNQREPPAWEKPADATDDERLPKAVRDHWDETEFRHSVTLDRFPALELDDGYLHLLALVELTRAAARTPGVPMSDQPLALGASMIRPGDLPAHLEAAAADVAIVSDLPPSAREAHERRVAFLQLVRDVGGCGVIEVQTVLDNRGLVAPPARPLPPKPPEPVPVVYEDDPEGGRSMVGRGKMLARLHAEVEAAVRQAAVAADGRGGKVNASSQPHEVTTDVLGHWVRQRPPEEARAPLSVRVVYADGSEAAPFPACRLNGRTPPSGGRVLKFALMSMRHLDLDRVVDMAWYRNREVSQSRALADSDAFCFAYSLAELKALSVLAGPDRAVTVHMYHTGFEPACIGFYRAVAAVLAADEAYGAGWARDLPPGWLSVVPHYFQGGTRYEPSHDRDKTPLVWC
jgi:hypothetical protein